MRMNFDLADAPRLAIDECLLRLIAPWTAARGSWAVRIAALHWQIHAALLEWPATGLGVSVVPFSRSG